MCESLHRSCVRTLVSTRQPESVDDCCERSWLLLAERIVEEEAWERWRRVLHHTNQLSLRQMWRNSVVGDECQAGTVDRGSYDQILIVQDKRAAHRDRNRLVPFVEFPFIYALPAVPEVDTSMIEQVSWGRRP